MESSSARRNLFTECFTSGSSKDDKDRKHSPVVVELIEDNLPHENESSEKIESLEEFFQGDSTLKEPVQKILIIGLELAKEIQKLIDEASSGLNIKHAACLPSEVPAFCNTERFGLLLVDVRCAKEERCLQKICSNVRYDSRSLNNTTSIIGITPADYTGEDLSSQGLNDTLQLPLKVSDITQLLLKWAEQSSCKGMPLTPESPEDEVITARKAAEIIKETEEQAMLVAHVQSCEQIRRDQEQPTGLQHESSMNPSLMCTQAFSDYSHQSNMMTSNTSIKDTSATQPLQDPSKTQSTGYGPRIPGSITAPCPSYRSASPSMSYATQAHCASHLQNSLPYPGCSSQRAMESFPGQHMELRQLNQAMHPYSSGMSSSIPCRPVLRHPFASSVAGGKILERRGNPPPVADNLHSYSAGKMQSVGTPAYIVSGTPGSKDMKITLVEDDLTKHSSKERIRRERIKESCDQLRFLLPNVTGKKTDMASILEMTVKFVRLVNERIPPPVMEEIARKLSPASTSQSRKRSHRDHQNTKQARMRISQQVQEERAVSPMLTDDPMRTARAQALVSSPGPLYLPHMHMGPGQHLMSHQSGYGYLQPQVVNYNNGCGSDPMSKDFTPMQTSVITYGNSMPHVIQPESDVNTFHHGQRLSATPLTVNTSNLDSPQQWNFLKLPPINTISPSNSSVDLSASSLSSLD
ncbi:uncharacterized protein LOC5519324 [Nematostella vectensis]|uniref:uncharacterized protein LOC5519324 n=1 Tax=Nematostella vectensis TaxID=45351 RepID=UPI0020777D63|nr:uncharacterized protein LOC5519324 [Nematostella vectensis]